jgi:serine/threonine protein phosphatase PrpC
VRVGKSAGVSDPGRKRRHNEDSFVVQPPLFAVADGMGGAQAGEVASKLAAGALEETQPGAVRGAEDIVELIQEANRRVHARSTEDPSTSGMGTTMTVALVQDGHVLIGHVGDSRAYRVRDGKLEQLTEDHSLVNELVKGGKLSREEAEVHPQRSVITRAVGTDPDVDVETYPVETREGDLFVLCSDGLTDMVAEADILAILERHRDDLDRAARALVQAANRGGGEDNITVVAFEIAAGDGADELEQTMQMPAAEDEDTLSGLESVPVVDTMVVRPDEVEQLHAQAREAAAAAAPSRRGAHVRLVATMLLLLAIAAFLVVWGLLR